MTNDECRRNDECQNAKPIALEFVIRISSLFRHSTVVLRRFPDKLLSSVASLGFLDSARNDAIQGFVDSNRAKKSSNNES